MAISINWGTKVILVPKADLTLIQSSPTEIREMELNWFRLELKKLEYSIDGISKLDTHKHNTEVTLGGLTFARVIEIINGYTVTFEDGQYAVNLVGANSNVGDKVNVNQVSVRSQNSAGLISSPAIEYASFNGGVIYDATSSYTGTAFPRGTEQMKLNNIPDVLLVANYRGFNKVYFYSDATLSADSHLDNFILQGQSHVNIHVHIEEEAQVHQTVLVEMTVTGTLDGGNSLTKCIVGDITYLNGHIHDSALIGNIALDGNKDAYLVNCSMSDWDHIPSIDMGNAGQDLIMIQFTGLVDIKNMHGMNKIGIGLVGGVIRLDPATVTSGLIQVSGTGRLTDTAGNHIESGIWNGGVRIINELISSDSMSNNKIVFIDTVNGGSGTSYPLGELNSPVNNLEDALSISENYGISKLHIKGPLTITSTDDISGYTLFADRSLGNSVTVVSGATTNKTYFENLTVSGTMDGSVRYTTCVLGTIHGFDGGAKNSLLTNDISIVGNGANYFTECDTYITDSSQFKLINIRDKNVNFIRCRGNFEIANKTSTNTTAIDLVAGTVLINNTCTAGEIFMDGIVHVIDNSAVGCTVTTTNALDMELTVNAIWEKDISSYAINTAGNILLRSEDEIREAAVVYWDATSSNTGTDYPIGSVSKPARNLSDVLTICERYGIQNIRYRGWSCSIGATENVDNYNFELVDITGGLSAVASTASSYSFRVHGGYLMGVFDHFFYANECDVTGISYLSANFKESLFRNNINCTATMFTHSTFIERSNTTSNVSINIGPGKLDMLQCSGEWTITHKTSSGTFRLDFITGKVTIADTCTAGVIVISGADEVIDNSAAGCTVTIISSEVNIQSIVDGVWDEVALDHNTDGTTGKELLDGGTGVTNPAAIASAVWNAESNNYNTSGTMGEKQNTGGSGDPDAIADAVWEEASGDHEGNDTMGELQNKIDSLVLAKPKIVPGE